MLYMKCLKYVKSMLRNIIEIYLLHFSIPYTGGVFACAYAYADDLTILCPSVNALHEISQICEEYAKKYDITLVPRKTKYLCL